MRGHAARCRRRRRSAGSRAAAARPSPPRRPRPTATSARLPASRRTAVSSVAGSIAIVPVRSTMPIAPASSARATSADGAADLGTSKDGGSRLTACVGAVDRRVQRALGGRALVVEHAAAAQQRAHTRRARAAAASQYFSQQRSTPAARPGRSAPGRPSAARPGRAARRLWLPLARIARVMNCGRGVVHVHDLSGRAPALARALLEDAERVAVAVVEVVHAGLHDRCLEGSQPHLRRRVGGVQDVAQRPRHLAGSGGPL